MSLSPLFALVLLSACIDDGGPIDGVYPEHVCTGDTAVDSAEPVSFVPVPRDAYSGTVYSGLDVAWFQWILSQPFVGNAWFDPTGADCASGQSGDVWFLAGSFNETVVERTCTIPSGKAIFVPILNEFTSCFFGDASCTEECLAPELDGYLDGVSGMYATVDGEDIGDPADYRVDATEFSADLPEGNLFQALEIPITGRVEDLYGGGYWMLFDPLPAGTHTIAFGGEFPDGRARDITYTLRVEE